MERMRPRATGAADGGAVPHAGQGDVVDVAGGSADLGGPSLRRGEVPMTGWGSVCIRWRAASLAGTYECRVGRLEFGQG